MLSTAADISPFITAQIPYWTALLAGALGGVHCLGMCGGVLGALAYGLPAPVRADARAVLPYVLAYNLGRISTYVLLGGLIGGLGALAGDAIAAYGGWSWLRAAAGLIMIAMGLYLAGWWFGLLAVERLGAGLWARLEPLRRRVMPVSGPRHAYLFGLVWGLLPCGLVYTMLIWALAAGGPLQGAGFLAAFGLGTLPLLTLLGLGAARGTGRSSGPWTRRLAGALVMLFGAWTLVSAFLHDPGVGLGCLPAS